MTLHPENNTYSYDKYHSYCFNTTTLHGIGVELWSEDDDWEMVNWYYKLERCHDKDTCESEENIDEFIKNLIITRIIE